MQLAQAFQIVSGDVIAFVGGGGKTSAMFQLATELTKSSYKVLTTTSTRIFAAQIQRAPAHVTFDEETQSVDDILPALDVAIAEHGQVLLIGRADPESGKAFGIGPQTVDVLAASGHFDVIINEADGSRMRPFKAPAQHEPVIPESTTILTPVVGLDILGQPLNDETVHRANLVSELSGLLLGQPITIDTVATVITHIEGGQKNRPEQARFIPLLNKTDQLSDIGVAQALAGQLLKDKNVQQVILSSLHNETNPVSEVWGQTAIVILAAGASSRFGSPKQLARWHDQTFLERAVTAALAVKDVYSVTVVLGAEVEQCRALLQPYPVNIVINERWAEGQSTSMQAGLASLSDIVGSAAFLLVDLPQITPDIITQLIQRHRETLAPIVWPEFEGKRGNPVIFDRALFEALGQVSGDTGGRPLIQAYRAQAERVSVNTPVILQDFDRPEDLAQALQSDQSSYEG